MGRYFTDSFHCFQLLKRLLLPKRMDAVPNQLSPSNLERKTNRHLDVIQPFPFSLGKNGEVHPNCPMKKEEESNNGARSACRTGTETKQKRACSWAISSSSPEARFCNSQRPQHPVDHQLSTNSERFSKYKKERDGRHLPTRRWLLRVGPRLSRSVFLRRRPCPSRDRAPAQPSAAAFDVQPKEGRHLQLPPPYGNTRLAHRSRAKPRRTIIWCSSKARKWAHKPSWPSWRGGGGGVMALKSATLSRP
ncbi:hypothetical protein KSP39_PZI007839 [Platanthera zijinensis]|uniref:Uncharacterized protein n=1 Tax=Platanthera zijinensis TaxID=2320716 RepID=A0AAP0BP67_9ASPA